MDEKLQKQLAEIVEQSFEAVKQGGAWAVDKAPHLVEQFLMWELWSSIFFFIIFGVIPLMAGIHAIISLKKEYQKPRSDNKYADGYSDVTWIGGFTWMTAFFGTFIGFIATLTNGYNIIFILVAPEIYLIQRLIT